jgi:hypothetical protein
MEHGDLLQTIAEVGAALAGFAGVISIFRGRLPGPEQLIHVHSARNIIEVSLGAVLFSFAPPIVQGLGAGPILAWRISSGFAALALLLSSLFIIRRLRHLARAVANKSFLTFEPGLSIPASLIAAITLVLLSANALGLFERAPTVYVLSLLGPLVIAGMIFVRLIIIAGRALR